MKSKPNIPSTQNSSSSILINDQKHELIPTTLTERINSIDIIRGIAVLGILLLNIIAFGLASDDPTICGGADRWNIRIWAFVDIFFEGTMRGLFTMLFGVGFMIFTSRGITKGVGINTADYYTRRILWLLFFGAFHSYVLLWYGEILFIYAICGLMLFAFRTVKPKYLIVLGILVLTIGSLKYVMEYRSDLNSRKAGLAAELLLKNNVELSEEQELSLKNWEAKKSKSIDVDRKNKALHQSYLSIAKYRFHETMRNHTVNLYNYYFWDSFGFMLIGMAFFTWGVFHAKRSNRFYFIMMLVGFALGLSVNLYEMNLVRTNNFSPIAISQAKVTYHAGRLFMTLGHIGLIMIFIKSGILRFLQNALAAVGKMAFSNYIVHTIICNFIFLGFGLSLFGKLQRYELYFVVIAIWIVQLIYSPIWLKYFRYGPLEWLWRSLTYSKIQPFKK